jgi:predicted small secreted protein
MLELPACSRLTARAAGIDSNGQPEENPMNRTKLILLALLAAFALSGCNTIAGVGKDVKKAGEVVEETAEDAKG